MKAKFTTTINKELLTKVKMQAVKENRNVNEIIEVQLEKYLKGEKEMTNRNEIIRQFAELIGENVGTEGNYEAYLAIDGEDVQMDVRQSGSFGEVDNSPIFITKNISRMMWAEELENWFGDSEGITKEENYEDFLMDIMSEIEYKLDEEMK